MSGRITLEGPHLPLQARADAAAAEVAAWMRTLPPDQRFSRARGYAQLSSPPPCARSSSRPASWLPSARRRSARRPYPPSWPQPCSPSSLRPSLARSCEPVPSSPPPSSQVPSSQVPSSQAPSSQAPSSPPSSWLRPSLWPTSGRRLLGSLLAGRFLRALACTAATLAAAVLLVHGGPGNALGGAFTRAAITFAFLDVLGLALLLSVYADLSPRGMTILLSLWSGQQAQLGLTRPLAGGGRRRNALASSASTMPASLPTRAAFSSAWPPASLAMAFRCAHARLTNSSAALSFDNAFDASTLSTTATASNTADGVPASCPSAACIAPSLSVAPPTLGATSFTSAPAFRLPCSGWQ